MSVSWETVRKIALALDHVQETTSYGTPAFKASGALFVRQHQDGKSLVLACDFDRRQELMSADPGRFYITDHYTAYPWILASMARIEAAELRDLMKGAHRFALTQKAKGRSRQRRS